MKKLFVMILLLSPAWAQEKDTTTPKGKYDHDKHEKVLEKQGLDCTHCHPFKLDRKDQSIEIPVAPDKLLIKPAEELCHTCHRQAGRERKELFVCSGCHIGNEGIMPENHKSGWIKKHAVVTYSPLECQNCHDDNYCIDCHRKFEAIKPTVHSRNFKFFHSVEARVNPISCYSCHRQTMCIDCHEKGSDF